MHTRERATVRDIRYGKSDDYGVLMLNATFEFDCAVQGLGGLCLDDRTGPAIVAELCAMFGVKTIDEIAGRRCFVLRCWPRLHEPIEGLEVDGRRWTLTDFRRRNWPEKTWDRLADRTDGIQREIERHASEIDRCVDRLRNVRDGYVDWSTQCPSDAKESSDG
jgi:hypothetical protein